MYLSARVCSRKIRTHIQNKPRSQDTVLGSFKPPCMTISPRHGDFLFTIIEELVGFKVGLLLKPGDPDSKLHIQGL